jgi:MYXO-CTERM domain-containing protein
MVNGNRSLLIGAMVLCAAVGARAQESNTVIGPPQLKDFRLEGRRQAPPAPPAQPPAQTPPAASEPSAEAPPRQAPARVAATPRRTPPPAPAMPRSGPADPIPMPPADAAPADAAPAAPTSAQAPPETAPAAPTPAAGGEGTSYWYYALPAAMLALLGLVVVRRRRRTGAEPVAVPAPAAAAPPAKPRPDPIPRPWLELSLKAERASFTAAEAELQFELEIANKGKSDARNLRIDVKMFNGGAEQDKEIGAFFKTAGREATKLSLPVAEAGVTGVIHGRVTLALEDMRAMRLDERLLFIPVVAVNALYDWGEGRTGQTSKSYVIGRELQAPSEKMGAFRVDQGPRVWRTVGQRPHKLAKRV